MQYLLSGAILRFTFDGFIRDERLIHIWSILYLRRYTHIERKIVSLTLLNNFLIHNYIFLFTLSLQYFYFEEGVAEENGVREYPEKNP